MDAQLEVIFTLVLSLLGHESHFKLFFEQPNPRPEGLIKQLELTIAVDPDRVLDAAEVTQILQESVALWDFAPAPVASGLRLQQLPDGWFIVLTAWGTSPPETYQEGGDKSSE